MASNEAHSQLQTLTWEMIKKDATSPAKLRAKAAECRGLIPFGVALAKFHNGDPHRLIVAHLMNHLDGDPCVGHICALPGREDSPDLQEVCLALHSLGEGSLGAGGFVFLEDQAKAAPSAGAPGVHCSGSRLPISILDVYG